MSDTVAVVLAGGAGRRMGGAKPERLFNGERLIDVALRSARAWGLRPAVAVRHRDQIETADCELILDADFEGPVGGLVSALCWAREEAAQHVMILPCDMPLLPNDLFWRCQQALQSGDAPIVAASSGRWHPVCALWPVSCLPAVLEYANKGGVRLAGALEHCRAYAVEWSTTPIDPFFNLNTTGDLRDAERFAAQWSTSKGAIV